MDGTTGRLTFLAAVLGALLLLFLVQTFKKRWRLSYRCSSCGGPICERCGQGPAKDPGLCKPCYAVFRGKGGVDLKVKMEKRSEVQRYRDIWSRGGMAASLLVPGSGMLALGWTGAGLLLFLPAALILSGPLTGYLTWPGSGLAYRGGVSGHGLVLVSGYLLLMIVSLLVYRSRVERWG